MGTQMCKTKEDLNNYQKTNIKGQKTEKQTKRKQSDHIFSDAELMELMNMEKTIIKDIKSKEQKEVMKKAKI